MARQLKRRIKPKRQLKRRPKPWPYTFDYDNKDFLQYFRSVTGIHIGDEDNKELSRFLLTKPNADHWLKTSKNFKYLTGIMVPFKYREDSIKMNKMLKDKLQKHWEIYNKPRKLKRRVQ